MNSRANNWTLIGGLSLAIAASATLSACEKKKAPPPPPPPPPPVAAGPSWTLEDVLAGADPRLQFPESRTPSTRELAESIVKLGTAILTGNDKDMTALLDPVDHPVMSDLVASGGWKSGTTGIEAVRVCVLEEGEGKTSCRLGLGVQDKMGAYLLAWKGGGPGGTWTFQGLSIVPQLAERVAALDGASLIEPTIDVSAPVIVELPEQSGRPDSNTGTGTDSSSPAPSGPGDEPPPPSQKPPG